MGSSRSIFAQGLPGRLILPCPCCCTSFRFLSLFRIIVISDHTKGTNPPACRKPATTAGESFQDTKTVWCVNELPHDGDCCPALWTPTPCALHPPLPGFPCTRRQRESGAARLSHSLSSHGGGTTAGVGFFSASFLELRGYSGRTALLH